MKALSPLLQVSRYVGSLRNWTIAQKRMVHYVQGQEPEPKIREYFYYIDHQGMLFLDDSKMKNFTSCFKEKKFLDFFFKRIRLNKTGRFTEEFPFISLCGRERNFIRCDDVPIVYTHIITKDMKDYVTYGYAGELLITPFVPHKIYMLPLTGRVYHPADDKYGGIGLVRSNLSIELSKHFEFYNGDGHPPTHFTWKNEKYELDQNWFQEKVDEHGIKIKTDPD
ncbi:UPF0598 protein CG30010 [Leguminivora glycinivorella]|uniref:UPF0598 protein CG30010 n=1 Tax=Leguminivora glycinivorella TaxID=1035111 RepID=UPI00200C6736|nr:UPF0598 protein CG30010 [Leguminivora glycinivorella]